MGNRKLSIVIPTYNRYQMTINSFAQVINDDRVSEVIIVDDKSNDGSFEKLLASFDNNEGKVKVGTTLINVDCYRNKNVAVDSASNEWCILLDSDNVIGPDYLDRLFDIEQWEPDTVYLPSFAAPHFDYRQYSGLTVTRDNVKDYIDQSTFETAMNTCNFFVNRAAYLKAFDSGVDPITSDSIYMNYRLLEQGNKLYFVPHLQYEHKVHDGSHYQNNRHRTAIGFHEQILSKIKQL